MDIVLEATGLEYPGKNVFFRPDIPIALSHLDIIPNKRIGEDVRFGVYTNQDLLFLKGTPEGIFYKQFYQDQADFVEISNSLQIDKTLSGMLLPFTKLERVFAKTGTFNKLDGKNIEMLKILGYIE